MLSKTSQFIASSLFLLPILLAPPLVLAQDETSRALTQGAGQSPLSLMAFLTKLKKKTSVVGGTVLRGEGESTALHFESIISPLYLQDLSLFKVLPGNQTLRLMWESAPQQQWRLLLGEHDVRIQGGSVELPMPRSGPLSRPDSLNTWELRELGDSSRQLSGFWFILRDIEAEETQELSILLAEYRATGLTQAPEYREVCQWMQEERLVNFNHWCLQP